MKNVAVFTSESNRHLPDLPQTNARNFDRECSVWCVTPLFIRLYLCETKKRIQFGQCESHGLILFSRSRFDWWIAFTMCHILLSRSTSIFFVWTSDRIHERVCNKQQTITTLILLRFVDYLVSNWPAFRLRGDRKCGVRGSLLSLSFFVSFFLFLQFVFASCSLRNAWSHQRETRRYLQYNYRFTS